eukprot:CAMPEP_0170755060 /NCGR_PEP_ID=MMETSP0437-20130122/13321_1 /TAXON_ID=0 /ORGANISM="Sexangularia sp." /LENGTH=97 /DNA_ID=CAMNT_0011094213 /DNA_START=261 /DNA_END=554 /DNA_ORIENTATION=-
MTSIAPVSALAGGGMFAGEGIPDRVRLWLFVSMTISFGAIIAGIWIMAAIYSPPDKQVEHQWPGVALALQVSGIFIASLVGLWGRIAASQEEGYDVI